MSSVRRPLALADAITEKLQKDIQSLQDLSSNKASTYTEVVKGINRILLDQLRLTALKDAGDNITTADDDPTWARFALDPLNAQLNQLLDTLRKQLPGKVVDIDHDSEQKNAGTRITDLASLMGPGSSLSAQEFAIWVEQIHAETLIPLDSLIEHQAIFQGLENGYKDALIKAMQKDVIPKEQVILDDTPPPAMAPPAPPLTSTEDYIKRFDQLIRNVSLNIEKRSPPFSPEVNTLIDRLPDYRRGFLWALYANPEETQNRLGPLIADLEKNYPGSFSIKDASTSSAITEQYIDRTNSSLAALIKAHPSSDREKSNKDITALKRAIDLPDTVYFKKLITDPTIDLRTQLNPNDPVNPGDPPRDTRLLIHYIVGNPANNVFLPLLFPAATRTLDIPDINGLTPLHHALQKNNLDALEVLIQNGANPMAVFDEAKRMGDDIFGRFLSAALSSRNVAEKILTTQPTTAVEYHAYVNFAETWNEDEFDDWVNPDFIFEAGMNDAAAAESIFRSDALTGRLSSEQLMQIANQHDASFTLWDPPMAAAGQKILETRQYFLESIELINGYKLAVEEQILKLTSLPADQQTAEIKQLVTNLTEATETITTLIGYLQDPKNADQVDNLKKDVDGIEPMLTPLGVRLSALKMTNEADVLSDATVAKAFLAKQPVASEYQLYVQAAFQWRKDKDVFEVVKNNLGFLKEAAENNEDGAKLLFATPLAEIFTPKDIQEIALKHNIKDWYLAEAAAKGIYQAPVDQLQTAMAAQATYLNNQLKALQQVPDDQKTQAAELITKLKDVQTRMAALKPLVTIYNMHANNTIGPKWKAIKTDIDKLGPELAAVVPTPILTAKQQFDLMMANTNTPAFIKPYLQASETAIVAALDANPEKYNVDVDARFKNLFDAVQTPGTQQHQHMMNAMKALGLKGTEEAERKKLLADFEASKAPAPDKTVTPKDTPKRDWGPIDQQLAKQTKERLLSVEKNIVALEARQYSADKGDDPELAQKLLYQLDNFLAYSKRMHAAESKKYDYSPTEALIQRVENIIAAHKEERIALHGDKGAVVTANGGDLNKAMQEKIKELLGESAALTSALIIEDGTKPSQHKTTEKFTEGRVIIAKFDLNDLNGNKVSKNGVITQQFVATAGKPTSLRTELRLPSDIDLTKKTKRITGAEIPDESIFVLAKTVVEDQMRARTDKSKPLNFSGHPNLVEAAKIYCEYKGYPYPGQGDELMVKKKEELDRHIYDDPTFLFGKEELGLMYSGKEEKRIQAKTTQDIEIPPPRPGGGRSSST